MNPLGTRPTCNTLGRLQQPEPSVFKVWSYYYDTTEEQTRPTESQAPPQPSESESMVAVPEFLLKVSII